MNEEIKKLAENEKEFVEDFEAIAEMEKEGFEDEICVSKNKSLEKENDRSETEK